MLCLDVLPTYFQPVFFVRWSDKILFEIVPICSRVPLCSHTPILSSLHFFAHGMFSLPTLQTCHSHIVHQVPSDLPSSSHLHTCFHSVIVCTCCQLPHQLISRYTSQFPLLSASCASMDSWVPAFLILDFTCTCPHCGLNIFACLLPVCLCCAFWLVTCFGQSPTTTCKPVLLLCNLKFPSHLTCLAQESVLGFSTCLSGPYSWQ